MKVTMTDAEKLLGLGIEEYSGDDVEALEAFIIDCNDAANAEEGTPLVADAVYDRLMDILREVKPEAPVLKELWTAEGDITDYSELLQKHPMMSIQTVKNWDDKELIKFVSMLEDESDANGVSVFLSYKLDGHGVRVVYNNGELVLATSRARASAGLDRTAQMRNILGDRNEELAELGLVEVRGELCLPLSKLERAREFNPGIKSAFSGVSSMVRASATPEENQLLHFLAYRAISEDFMDFRTKSEEYDQLDQWGFETPDCVTVEIDTEAGEDILSELKSAVESFEADYEAVLDDDGQPVDYESEGYDYYCDGIVAEIDSRDGFNSMQTNGVRSAGNIALKVNRWAQEQYQGIVQYIEWTEGKSKYSPVAIVSEQPGMAIVNTEDGWSECMNYNELGVLTAQGNTVRRVPLYEPKNILILDAYPGHPLNFFAGVEAGIVPCTDRGDLLKDDAVRNLVSES